MSSLKDYEKIVREVRIYDSKIEEVANRITNKIGINKEKAKTELKIGIVMGMMMNRHIIQEIQNKEK